MGCEVWGLGRDPFRLALLVRLVGEDLGAPSGRGTPSKAVGDSGGRTSWRSSFPAAEEARELSSRVKLSSPGDGSSEV